MIVDRAGIVLDCSIAMTWCFEDEATDATRAVLERMESEYALVPSLWRVEIANVLAITERRGRITRARATEFVEALAELSILVDEETSSRALGPILELARSQNLPSYDAAYLELAMRRGVPLATTDRALRAAAESAGVPLLGG